MVSNIVHMLITICTGGPMANLKYTSTLALISRVRFSPYRAFVSRKTPTNCMRRALVIAWVSTRLDASRRGQKILNPSRDEYARRVPRISWGGGGGGEEPAIMTPDVSYEHY